MLIPRAVGYSAALLDYFFRGEIEITLPFSTNTTPPQLDGIYSFTDDGSLGFRSISLMARNITPDNEEMINGHVSLVLSYRLGSSTPFVPNPPVPEAERYCKIYSCPGVTAIPRDNPIRLDVDMSINPLPVNAVDITLTVVFKGDLGAEQKDALAIGFKDISEPTPIDLFNNTDLVCFNGSYVNYADPALLQQVDTNHNGVIDCGLNEINIIAGKIKPIYLSFNDKVAKEDNYYYKFPEANPLEIMPGKSHRFFVLTDDYPAVTKLGVLVRTKNIDLENSLVPYSGICPSAFSNNKIDDIKPYFNKLEWNVNEKKFKQLYAPIHSIRGLFVFILKCFDNVHVPESATCSMNASSTVPNNSVSTKNNGTNKIEGGEIIQIIKGIK